MIEGIKSFLKEIIELVQWLKYNMINNIKIGYKTKVRKSKIARNVRLGKYCNVRGGWINSYSYIGDYCELPQVEIGKFCSIAAHVTLAAGNHPTDYVSTSPYTYSNIKNSFTSKKLYTSEFFYTDEGNRYLCKIGNDVWIGTGAMLVCGNKAINIGDGAVIAAGSVVTKDVPPYSIVAGCPAKIIRYRFTDEMISRFEKEKWWDKDEKWIRESIGLFSDPQELLKRLRDR